MLLAASLFVASPTFAQSYAPSFPRDGAKKAFENELMTVWDVTWEKGRPTPMQEHRFDQVAVNLTDGAVKVTRPDKTWSIDQARLGSVRFEPKGTVAAEEGVSDQPRRALVVEIKSYAGAVVDAKVTEGLKEAKAKGIPGQFPREGAIKLFENERLTVWDNRWPPGVEGPLHAHYRTVVGLFVEAGELGPTAVRPVGWVNYSAPRMPPHTEIATKGSPRAIFLEWK
jgi:hypothetical protein